MPIYKIKKYEQMKDAHRLVEKNTGEGMSVDIMMNWDGNERPEELVGKEVEIKEMRPYLLIAEDVEVL